MSGYDYDIKIGGNHYGNGYGNYGNNGRNSNDNDNALINEAATWGLNLDDFTINGQIDYTKLRDAIRIEKERAAKNSYTAEGEADTFVRTTSGAVEEVAKKEQAEDTKEEITQVYKEAVAQCGSSEEAEDALEALAEEEYRLTQQGTTSATVISGSASFFNMADEIINSKNDSAEETEEVKAEEVNMPPVEEAEADDSADDLLANNPFYSSAYSTFEIEEEEEEIAA